MKYVIYIFKNILYKMEHLLSLPELEQVMANMGERLSEAEVTRMMTQADSDSDGLISFQEFATMMAK